jgi:hypothetical protein
MTARTLRELAREMGRCHPRLSARAGLPPPLSLSPPLSLPHHSPSPPRRNSDSNGDWTSLRVSFLSPRFRTPAAAVPAPAPAPAAAAPAAAAAAAAPSPFSIGSYFGVAARAPAAPPPPPPPPQAAAVAGLGDLFAGLSTSAPTPAPAQAQAQAQQAAPQRFALSRVECGAVQTALALAAALRSSVRGRRARRAPRASYPSSQRDLPLPPARLSPPFTTAQGVLAESAFVDAIAAARAALAAQRGEPAPAAAPAFVGLVGSGADTDAAAAPFVLHADTLATIERHHALAAEKASVLPLRRPAPCAPFPSLPPAPSETAPARPALTPPPHPPALPLAAAGRRRLAPRRCRAQRRGGVRARRPRARPGRRPGAPPRGRARRRRARRRGRSGAADHAAGPARRGRVCWRWQRRLRSRGGGCCGGGGGGGAGRSLAWRPRPARRLRPRARDARRARQSEFVCARMRKGGGVRGTRLARFFFATIALSLSLSPLTRSPTHDRPPPPLPWSRARRRSPRRARALCASASTARCAAAPRGTLRRWRWRERSRRGRRRSLQRRRRRRRQMRARRRLRRTPTPARSRRRPRRSG